MDLRIVDNYEDMSAEAAKVVAGLVEANNDAVLGLATGSTPEGMYSHLVKMCRKGLIDFSSVTTFNLDEYVDLPPHHPQSYHYYMNIKFFDHINIAPRNTHIPHCHDIKEAENICCEFDHKIKQAGGVDLQILGIGVNGHIGFNEPAPFLQTKTHLVDLAEETIDANSRFFKSREEVPSKAITMGIGSIMNAGIIMLLASGEGKARAIKDSFSGLLSTETPASLLQLHNNLIVIIDQEAASLL